MGVAAGRGDRAAGQRQPDVPARRRADVRLPSAEPHAAGIAKEDRALPVLSGHVRVGPPDDLATFLVQLRAAPAGVGPAATAWSSDPVWFHGDIAEGNLLVRSASLCAVIHFGTCGVGDPACDLVIAWTLMGAERERFRAGVALDADTWSRAGGWALWKALVTLTDPAAPQYATQRHALDNLLAHAG